jgi:hypothetical protein
MLCQIIISRVGLVTNAVSFIWFRFRLLFRTNAADKRNDRGPNSVTDEKWTVHTRTQVPGSRSDAIIGHRRSLSAVICRRSHRSFGRLSLLTAWKHRTTRLIHYLPRRLRPSTPGIARRPDVAEHFHMQFPSAHGVATCGRHSDWRARRIIHSVSCERHLTRRSHNHD